MLSREVFCMHWNWATFLWSIICRFLRRGTGRKMSVFGLHTGLTLKHSPEVGLQYNGRSQHIFQRALFRCSHSRKSHCTGICAHISPRVTHWRKNSNYEKHGSRMMGQELRKILWGLDMYFVFMKLKRRNKTVWAELSYQNQNTWAALWRAHGRWGDFGPRTQFLSVSLHVAYKRV